MRLHPLRCVDCGDPELIIVRPGNPVERSSPESGAIVVRRGIRLIGWCARCAIGHGMLTAAAVEPTETTGF